MATPLKPTRIHPPFAPYNHGILVPEGQQLVFCSGQLGITPDKRILVAADAKGLVKIANIADHKQREVVGSVVAHPGGIRSVLVSPTGSSFLTVGTDNEIKVWSLAPAASKDPKATRSWKLPVGVNGVAYMPDGTHAVTANADGTAYVLELPGGDRK